jgi:hypothetical protein
MAHSSFLAEMEWRNLCLKVPGLKRARQRELRLCDAEHTPANRCLCTEFRRGSLLRYRYRSGATPSLPNG